jgi:uncharacterized protein UPF0158
MEEKIKLSLIIQEMEGQSDLMSAFFDKTTKEIVLVSDEEFRMAEDEEPSEDLPEWLQDQIKTAEEVLYGDSFIPLPSKFDIHEYNIMEKFCLSIRDRKLSDIMYHSIKGKGAFRNFKFNIRKYNIENDWYEFRDKAMRDIAIEWCEGNNINYEK